MKSTPISDDEYLENSVEAIGAIAKSGKLEECSHCGAPIGYIYEAAKVRTVLLAYAEYRLKKALQ